MIPIDHRLLAVARAGLPGAPPPPRDGWDGLIAPVIANGLAGLFSAGAAAGMIDIDAAMAARLQRQLYAEAVQAVQLEGELLRLGPALEHLGAVVLRGAVLAHGAYPDPLLRPVTTLDLLVAGHRVPEAVAGLATYGYRQTGPDSASGLDGQVGTAVTLEHEGGVVIDLHHSLVAGDLGAGIDVDGLLAAHRTVRVGAQTVPAPSWEVHLIACALHSVASAGLAQPLALRDVAEVAHHPLLDSRMAADLALRWQVWEPVGFGLCAAREGLGLDLPDALAALADRADDAAPAVAPPVGSTLSYLGRPPNADERPQPTMAPPLVGPSAQFPSRVNGGPAHPPHLNGRPWQALSQRAGGAHRDDESHVPSAGPAALEPGPPPATGATFDHTSLTTTAPALPATSAPQAPAANPFALAERTVPGPRWPTTQRTAAGSPAGGLAGGRQADWTRARPPRQGTTRARSRQGTPGAGGGAAGGDDGDGDDDGSDASASPRGPQPGATTRTGQAPPAAHGLAWGFAGGGLLVATAICTQLDMQTVGIVLVPLAALLLAGATARRIARRFPDEAWVGRWLVLAVVAKLTASYLRYHTLVGEYEGVGDANGYDQYGRRFAAAWLGGRTAPELPDLRRHNFVRWFTGAVYYVFGSDMVVGFFVFGLLALVGSYLWYRATVEAVPNVDKRLYLGLVLFVPSIIFWPSGIGKESLMQLGIGVVALGTAHLLRVRLAKGLVLGLAGGWLLWVVRPHLLALVTVAAGCAYAAGRVRAGKHGLGSLVGRPIGLLAVAVLMAITVSQGASFLGVDDLSLSSIEAELDEQTERSAEGGSQFDNGGNSLNPLYLPRGAVTVLLRPFPWETDSPLQLLSSLESVFLAALIVSRLPSLASALSRARSTPFLLSCWVLIILYAATFSSFANFGLLVRQRSLVLPALFVVIAVKAATPATRPPRRDLPSATLTGGVRAGR